MVMRLLRSFPCIRPMAGLTLASLLAAAAACGHGFALGGGVARASFGIGNTGSARVTPVLSARAFVPDSGKAAGGLLSLDVQPLSLHNPLRDETVTPIYLLPQLQLGRSQLCLRAGVGPAVHSWGGNDPAAGTQLVPSVGASVATDLAHAAGRSSSVEAYFRAAASVGEDGIYTTLVGVAVLIALR